MASSPCCRNYRNRAAKRCERAMLGSTFLTECATLRFRPCLGDQIFSKGIVLRIVSRGSMSHVKVIPAPGLDHNRALRGIGTGNPTISIFKKGIFFEALHHARVDARI